MANNYTDIPGFIRDPETGRYFRETPGGTKNPSLNKIKLEVKSKTAPEVRPSKITNVANFLRLKEIGSFNGVVAESEFCKRMVHNKEELKSEELSVFFNGQQNRIQSVHLIVGTTKSNIGFWRMRVGPWNDSILMERNFFGCQDNRRMNYKMTIHNPVDLCEYPNEVVVFINNRFIDNSFSKGIHCINKYSHGETLSVGKEALFCCSAFGDRCAAGGENCIKLFSLLNDVGDFIKLKGRVHTLSSNKAGNLLAAGLHDGRIQLYDIRTQELTHEIKDFMHSTCIVESAFRENSSYAIFAGLPDKLFAVDLRQNRSVTTYFGHSQALAKKHISMSDNMLCVTGSDNIIRIWHTSGGSPIYEMEAINHRENGIRGWLNSDGNKTYLNYFESGWHKVFKIFPSSIL